MAIFDPNTISKLRYFRASKKTYVLLKNLEKRFRKHNVAFPQITTQGLVYDPYKIGATCPKIYRQDICKVLVILGAGPGKDYEGITRARELADKWFGIREEEIFDPNSKNPDKIEILPTVSLWDSGLAGRTEVLDDFSSYLKNKQKYLPAVLMLKTN